jgi:peptidoglycan hydrolase CwlO-like protein
VIDESGDAEMQIPERARKLGANFNTFVMVAMGVLSIASSVGTSVWVTANKSRDIEDLQNWRTDTKTVLAALTERVRTTEDKQQAIDGRIDNLNYRANISEQNLAGITGSIKDLSSSVNELTGDVKVVREILQRQDRQAASPR